MNAKTISMDLCLRSMTLCAKVVTWLDSRFDKAEAVGMNKADAARMEVKRKADLERVKSIV
jgi:hypothetical protein